MYRRTLAIYASRVITNSSNYSPERDTIAFIKLKNIIISV